MAAFDRQRMTSYWCSKVTSGPDWAAVELQAAKVNRAVIARTNKSGRVHIDTRRNATQDDATPRKTTAYFRTTRRCSCLLAAQPRMKSRKVTSRGADADPLLFLPVPSPSPTITPSRFTHSLPHSSLPLNTARRFGGNLLCCPANNDRKLQK